jgi:hypothetical protein
MCARHPYESRDVICVKEAVAIALLMYKSKKQNLNLYSLRMKVRMILKSQEQVGG